jgi:hypothetical protein
MGGLMGRTRRNKMKKKVEVQEVADEGLVALLNKKVLVFCLNYIYTGELEGVNDTCILLKNPSIVYETGAFNTTSFKDAQKLPHSLYIQTSAIESFGETNKE